MSISTEALSSHLIDYYLKTYSLTSPVGVLLPVEEEQKTVIGDS